MAEGGTTAPAAPTTTAPTNGATPAGTVAEAKPVGPKTVWDISKEPVKYRVGGKERTLDSWDKVQQRLSFSEANEERAKTLEQKLRETEPRLQKFDGLKKAAPKDFWKGLVEEFGQDAVDRASAEYYQERIAQEDKDKALSPEARRYKEDAERKQAELEKLQTDAQKREEEAEQRKHEEQTARYAQFLDGVIGEALEHVPGIGPDAAQFFMPVVAADIHRADQLGLDVDPKSVAQSIQKVQHGMAVAYLTHLTPEGVVDLLEAIALPGADGKPGSNMRKASMVAWHMRSQKKANSVDGETPTQEPVQMLEQQPRAARRPNAKPNETWKEIRAILKQGPVLSK